MKEREELENILTLIRKYNLPLSPILEYAIKEKMEEYPETVGTDNSKEPNEENEIEGSDEVETTMHSDTNGKSSFAMKIVEYGERTIAVVGDTKPHKDALKALGGYFVLRTQWGAAWVFRSKKRERIQSYIDGLLDIDTILSEKDEKTDESKSNTRYIIRVKYPNGREYCSKLVWKTLIDVILYASPVSVRRLGIICMGDNLVSDKLNENPLYRNAQKEIGNGLFVCTYSSTDVKYNQIRRINRELRLGLEVEKVFVDENGNIQKNEDYIPYDISELKADTRDRTKYSFEGSQMLSKRRFVLEVVKYYVQSHPTISYESLIRVFPATLNTYKSNGVVKRYNDVAKQVALNPDVRNRFFMKDDEIIVLSNGLRVVVHNQWGSDFENFLKVAESLYNVKSSCDEDVRDASIFMGMNKTNKGQTVTPLDSIKDDRIGFTIRIFPSQLVGQITNVRINSKGIKKIVVRTKDNLVEIDDLPYLYEIIKRTHGGELGNNKYNTELKEAPQEEKTTGFSKGITEATKNSIGEYNRSTITYKDVAQNPDDIRKMKAILNAMEEFLSPVTPHVIACTINRTAWGDDVVREDTIDSYLKRLPEVEYVQWGKYILKRRNR